MGIIYSSNPVTVPSVCRIISSNVDIKSSSVCEFGFLNFKARHALYPKEKTTFRCHDDYYWASVFEVEFKEYFSGQTLHAVAEAPKEALPQDCRPSFDTAWMTKMKFKVNETYYCRYTLGSQKAEIYPDKLFNCHAKDTSTAEMLRRFFVLLTGSHPEKNPPSGRHMGFIVAGIVLGMLSSICCIMLFKILQVAASSLVRQWHSKALLSPFSALRLPRACVLVVYFSTVGWLLLQYPKMMGLKQLNFNSNLREQTS